MIFGDEERLPLQAMPTASFDREQFMNTPDDKLKVSWLGHSTNLIRINGHTILTDPIFAQKVSIVGPSRYNGKFPLKAEKLPDVDVCIISHNHRDHLNVDTIKQIDDKIKVYLVPLAVGIYLEQAGVDKNKIIELDWWEEKVINPALKIVATPSQHFAGRGPFDTDMALWASWVIESKGHKVFFSGDTGYFDGFKEIGEKYGPFNITLLEMGAYDEYWPDIHLFPEEAVQAHIDLKGRVLIPIHWGTFRLSFSHWYEPINRLISSANKNNATVATPIAGETVNPDQDIIVNRWWREEETIEVENIKLKAQLSESKN